MPNGKYDFEYDEPVSIPLDPETTLKAMLEIEPGDDEPDKGEASDASA